MAITVLMPAGWAICPDPNKPNCVQDPAPDETTGVNSSQSVPPVRFQPDILDREIQRAFTVGNPPTGKLIPETISAPAFVDEAPAFDGDYPVCGSDGVNAICH